MAGQHATQAQNLTRPKKPRTLARLNAPNNQPKKINNNSLLNLILLTPFTTTKGSHETLRCHETPGANRFFLRLYGRREGGIDILLPPRPPFDIETFEPIELLWQAIKEWIPDDDPDLTWFNHSPETSLTRMGSLGSVRAAIRRQKNSWHGVMST